MSKVDHSVSISTPFTVADIVAFANELGGLAADREVLLIINLNQDDEEGEPVAPYAKLSVEF